MNLRLTLLIFFALAGLACPAQAQLLNFTFTENVPGGTVTGEIEGLSDGATSTPTDIIITGQPIGSPAYPQTPTIDLIASGYGFVAGDDTFTVNATGTIVAADVGIYKIVASGPFTGDLQGYAFDLTDAGFTTTNGVYLTTASGSVVSSNANNLGMAGVTFTAVPEPRSTTAIFLLAGLSLLAFRRFHLWGFRNGFRSRNRLPLES